MQRKCQYCREYYNDNESLAYLTCKKCQNILDNKIVYNHAFKPIYEEDYFINRKNDLYIGFELEIEFNNKIDLNRFIVDFYKHELTKYFYLKDDATLSVYGIEIVSIPMTFNMYYNLNAIKQLFDIIQKDKGFNATNCGLHFHLDRKYFDDINIAIMDMYVNTNATLMEFIAERKMNRFCSIKRKNISEWGNHRHFDNRYNALNLINKNTIELRFFKSQVKYDKFINKIHFLNKFVELCKRFDNISDAMFYTYNSTEFNNELIVK
jgi:hypothetical protein